MVAIIVLAGMLIDGTGRDPLSKAAVVVENGHISRVGAQSEVSPGPDDQVIDAGDATLMPGLIDSHCHIFYIAGASFVSSSATAGPRTPEQLVTLVAGGLESARLWLSQGVTTIRDVAAEMNLDLGLRDTIASGRVIGPRIFGSGRALAITGGVRLSIENIAIQVNSATEARRAAREQLRAGVNHIKLFASAGIGGGEGRFVGESGWSQFTVEEMQAAIFEAHKAGRTVAAHAISTQSIKNAVQAGVDTVEHCTYLDEEGLTMMKERDVVMVPTLAVGETLAEKAIQFGYERHIAERSQLGVEKSHVSVQMAREAGLRIAAGTDPVTQDTIMRECDCLHRAGLTPMEVIVAATRTGAELLHMQDSLGTVEQGKMADLIVLDGNPLDDLWALERVRWVLKDGQVVKSPDD